MTAKSSFLIAIGVFFVFAFYSNVGAYTSFEEVQVLSTEPVFEPVSYTHLTLPTIYSV